MHTTTRRRRLRAGFTHASILALSLAFSQAAFGQDQQAGEGASVEAQIQKLLVNLEARAEELDELTKKVDQNADKAAAVIVQREVSDRRKKYRRDVATLVDLVLGGGDAGADVAQGRAEVTKILESDAPKIKETMRDLDQQMVELVEVASKGTQEEARKARADFIARIPESSRLVQYFEANLDQRKQLGLNVEADTRYLTERLQTRGNVMAALLSDTKTQIDELSAQPDVAADAEAQKSLGALRKQRDALAESQRANVDLMDKYGLQTAELRQGIISATGKLSQDIFDKDVAAGLLESWFADGADWMRSNGANLVFQFIIFLLILVASWFIARVARGIVRRAFARSKLDISSLAQDFFIKMTSRLIMLIGFIIAIAQLGVEVGPLLAGLGIAGFIIGFALQDTLSNFASGMMILIYRPFDVGDAVEAGGVLGKVDEMNLVSTMILTFDNQLVVVPNKQIWGGIIRNITHQETRRVDMTFGIGYSDDIPKAEKVLLDIVTSHDKVLKDPEPVVKLHTLGESSVDFVVRPWAKTDEYWDVYWDITREVKQRFDAEGISIPFPQRDVHIHQEGGGSEA